MKNKLKYILCTIISVLITFSIVALPNFYYTVKDSSKTEFKAEKLAIGTQENNNPSVSEIIELMKSENAISVDSKENMSDKSLLVFVTAALQTIRDSLKDSDYALWAIDLFLNDEDVKPAMYGTQIISGTVNGAPVSATLMLAEYYGNNFKSMSIIFDRKTYKVYKLEIMANDIILSDEVDRYYTEISKYLFEYYDDLSPTLIVEPYFFYVDIFSDEYDAGDEVIEQ